jgi:DNA-binding LacI/PurR family transcriptional regulator
MQQYPEMDAVFVSNDHMALGVLQYACQEGIQVPADLAVVGYDGIPESGGFWPPLTTVFLDLPELGRRMLRELVRIIENGGRREMATVHGPILLRPRIIVRSSTVGDST